MEKKELVAPEQHAAIARYEDAILFADLEEHQAQIDALRSDVQELYRYVQQSAATQTNATRRLPQALVTEWKAGELMMWEASSASAETLLSSKIRVLVPRQAGAKKAAEAAIESKSATVPLHALLKFCGVFMGLTATASLAVWLADYPAPINPFLSLLTLIAAPFVIGMGYAARR